MVASAFNELSNAFRDRDEQVGFTGEFNAYLGSRTGTIIADAPNRLVNYWTDSGDNGVAYLGEGCGIPLIETAAYRNKGIKLAYPPGVDSRKDVPHVIGLSREGLLSVGGVIPSEQKTNAGLFPKVNQIDLYRVTPTFPEPTLAVNISTGFVYDKSDGGRDYWQHANWDIPSAAMPSAGEHRLALLLFDRSTNAPDLVLGSAVANTSAPNPNRGAFTIADVLALEPGAGQDSLLILYLYGDGEQTAIEEADCLRQYEVRRWLGGGSATGGGHVIEDNGTPLTQRTNLNIIGATVSDDAGNDATVIELPTSTDGVLIDAYVDQLLYDDTLGSDTGTIDITSIAQTYDDLEIDFDGRTDLAGTSDALYVAFNNDTTDSNYRSAYVFGNSAAGGSGAGGSSSQVRAIGWIPSHGGPSDDNFSRTKIFISGYTDGHHKVAHALSHLRDTASTYSYVGNFSLFWLNTSAINRITLTANGNFVAGSRIRILGRKKQNIGAPVVSTDNVSNPPTDAELTTAFGSPADGFLGLLDDNNAGANTYLVARRGSDWWYASMTKAT